MQNWAITQDLRQVVYVANNLGLLAFDGTQWTRYPMANGSKVRSVLIDPKGKIYVAAQNEFGYFFPNEKGRLVYHSLSEKIPTEARNFGESWGIHLSLDGTVYFSTFQAIFTYREDTVARISEDIPLEFSFLVNEELYVLAPGKGLMRLRGTSLQDIPQGDFFADKRISAIVALSQRKMLIATFHGRLCLRRAKSMR